MKKVISIIVALALVLSLSIVATPALAKIHGVAVTVVENTVSTEAEYTIVFNIESTLGIGETVSVEFPADTEVPATYEYGDVKVGTTSISPGDIKVSDRMVTITLPMGIGAPAEVTVVFEETAGVTNPSAPGDYELSVRTSKETWEKSAEYTIRLSDKSKYKFVYEVPEMIWVDHLVEVDVTLQYDVLGLEGYAHVLVVFYVTEAPDPSVVTFQGYDGVNWLPDSPFENSGWWGPSEGFPVTKDYEATTPFRLTFNRVGVYTIALQLIDRDDQDRVLVDDEISVAVTGVSVDVELNKGWNLISLPIIPDNPAITAVLADIMDDVVSVHHYDAETGDWLIYSPPDWTSLTEIVDGKAYWINMKKAVDDFTVVGQAVAPPGFGPVPPAYEVVEGWNMVGFRSMTDMTVEEYLKGTDYVRIYGFDLKQGGWFTLAASANMTAGLGYWVAFSEDGTIYP